MRENLGASQPWDNENQTLSQLPFHSGPPAKLRLCLTSRHAGLHATRQTVNARLRFQDVVSDPDRSIKITHARNAKSGMPLNFPQRPS
jgi:hypothetical protein